MHTPHIAVHLELYSRKQVAEYVSRFVTKKASALRIQRGKEEEVYGHGQSSKTMEGFSLADHKGTELMSSSDRSLSEFEQNISIQLEFLAVWMEWIEKLRWSHSRRSNTLSFPTEESDFNPEMYFSDPMKGKQATADHFESDSVEDSESSLFVDVLSLAIEAFLLGCKGLTAFAQTHRNSDAIQMVCIPFEAQSFVFIFCDLFPFSSWCLNAVIASFSPLCDVGTFAFCRVF